MDLAETMAVEAVSYLPDTMSTKAPNIAQHAKLPEYKAGPSYSRYTMMGGLLGLILCAGVLIVRYLMDDTIHTAEDMEKYCSVYTASGKSLSTSGGYTIQRASG